MGVTSWLKSSYLRRVRNSYNDGNYNRSLKRGLLSWRLFGDKNGLDVAARSALRLRKFALASKLYGKAVKNNLLLRDHSINQFEAELKSGNLVQAFKLIKNTTVNNPEKNTLNQLIKEVKKIPKKDQFDLLKDMNIYDNLPEDLAKLVPNAVSKIPNKNTGNSFTLLKDDLMEADRYKREILRLRGSPSYKIGEHFAISYRKPWKLISLPFSLPILAFNLLREKSIPAELPNFLPSAPSMNSSLRRSVVLFPTNGVGFGHFTRLLAIARRMKQIDPDLEVIFFTTMPTLHITENEGFPSYHIPGRYRFNGMEASEWNSLAEEMISLVFTLHRPSAFIFDGSYPYRGMLNAIRGRPDMMKIWLRRGTIKSNSKDIPSDSLSHFDGVIIPGDSVPSESQQESNANIATMRCNPITLIDEKDEISTGKLRTRLGIPEEATVAYVQLGAGNINNINNELLHTLEALNKHKHVYTIYGESILGTRNSFDFERLSTLRDYPNSMFFNEFDFAIMAGGYNSFHEAIQSSLPTLCFPNLNTGRDDQLARCMVAQKVGFMTVLETRNKKKIGAAIDRMVNESVREKMKSKAILLQRDNGALQSAKWIIDNLPE